MNSYEALMPDKRMMPSGQMPKGKDGHMMPGMPKAPMGPMMTSPAPKKTHKGKTSK